MIQSSIVKRHILWAAALFFLTILACAPALSGQFVYDDISFILRNQAFQSVKSFWDCLTFHFQPTRPVANFFLAFSHWIGNGTCDVHRLVSVLLHALAVVLLYLNLSWLWRRWKPQSSAAVPIMASLWFAVFALQSEAIFVSQFRSEILASVFTLVALLATQLLSTVASRHRWLLEGAIFFCTGFAVLSKEVFAVVTPAALLFMHLALGDRKRRFFLVWLVTALFWGSVLYYLNQFDSESFSPHRVAVRVDALSTAEHLKEASRALIEGMGKSLAGIHLTTQRMLDREGWGSQLPLAWHVAILATWLISLGVIALQGRWEFFWALLGAVSTGIYLLIPNTNIGSEHYWYFPLAAFAALTAALLESVILRFTKRSLVFVILAAVFACYQVARLQTRLEQATDQKRFYEAELALNPGYVYAYTTLAGIALFEKNDVSEALSYLNFARQIQPMNSEIIMYDFVIAESRQDLAAEEESITLLEEVGRNKHAFLAQAYRSLAQLQSKYGAVEKANRSAQRASEHESKL